MASLTEEQLRKEFARVDKNNDGTITIDELRKYYLPMQEMLGVMPEVAEQEIRGLLKRLDVDNSGTISFLGSISICCTSMNKNESITFSIVCFVY
jgi:Ca2+-binding EF-hand superfamily protein